MSQQDAPGALYEDQMEIKFVVVVVGPVENVENQVYIVDSAT